MKKQVVRKAKRKRYSLEFKQQALQRAERDGVAQAALDLGLQEGQLRNVSMILRHLTQIV